MKRCVLVLIAVAAAACAQPAPATPATPVPTGPTPVRASFDRTWDAARRVLTQRGVQLAGSTRGPAPEGNGMLFGTLLGEFNPVPRYDVKLYSSDCGQEVTGLAHPVGDGDAHYTVTVEGDSVTSMVHVSIAVTEAGEACTTRRTFEAAAQGDIKSVAEAR